MAFSFSFRPAVRHKNVGLLSARYRDLLHFHFWPNLLKIIFQQLRLELLQLAPRCAHQILSPMLAHCPQVLFAHHSTIEDPNPSCFPVLALHRAQNGFQGGDIRPVPIEQFIAERKTLWIHDQSQHQLLAVRTMIARVATPHYGVSFRCSFHVRTGQVIQQHVELCLE